MMRLPVKLLYILLSVSFFLVSCKVKTPDDIIQPTAMEKLLYDYHLVQAMGHEVTKMPDYQLKLYYENIFAKHGVTKEIFDSSMVWYTRHPAHLYQIYSNLQEKLDHEVALLQDEKQLARLPELTTEDYAADKVNLWRGKKVQHLNSSPFCNRLFFSFESDSAFVVGDSIALNINTRFFSDKNRKPSGKLHAALLIIHTDSTVVSNGISIETSGSHALEFVRDYDRMIKSINGFVYYTDNDSTLQSGVLLNDISLLRMHPEE